MIRMALKAGKEGGQPQSEEIEAAEAQKVMSMPKSLLFLVVGVAGIVIGGDVVVDSASNIALKIGMSQTLVGLTIVSIGTSLPELVTSVVAARKMKSIWHLEMRSALIFLIFCLYLVWRELSVRCRF